MAENRKQIVKNDEVIAAVEVKTMGNVRVAVFPQRVEKETAQEIKNLLIGMISPDGPKILCDFSRTEVVAPAGLTAIVAALHRIHQAGGQMAFSMMKPEIRTLFNEAGLSQIFRLYDEEEALKVAVLKELAAHFSYYTDLHGILLQKSARTGVTVEIYLEFDQQQTMGQVQQRIDAIRRDLAAKLTVDRVLVIPTTQSIDEN